MCGTTHKTVRRIIEAHEAAANGVVPATPVRPRNYDEVAELVAQKVKSTGGRISAKRLLPAARAAGYAGSDRNFRRLVAEAKAAWRQGQARAGGRRPAIWSPGEVLAMDWGTEVVAGRKVHVFCAVLAWSRFRFVRFADDEQQSTTLGRLAECFEVLGGVPKTRFATHYRFRPDFGHAQDPESKGIVENLVGHTKDDRPGLPGDWRPGCAHPRMAASRRVEPRPRPRTGPAVHHRPLHGWRSDRGCSRRTWR